MKSLMIPLLLIASPAAAQSVGFSASDLTAAAATTGDQVAALKATRRIAAQTEILRAILATDMRRAAQRISADELRVLTAALGRPTLERDIALSWLMRSGLTTAADGELSGIYSPLADAWLVLRWETIGGAPRISAAALIRGTTLRPPAEGDWRGSEAPFAGELLRLKLQSFAIFARLPQDPGADRFFQLHAVIADLERTAVLSRSTAMVAALSAWSKANPATLARIDAATRKHADPALMGLPDKVRKAMGPIAVVESPQGALLLLQSPVYPAQTIVARIADPTATPSFTGVDLSPAPVRSAAR